MHIGLLGAAAVVQEADSFAHLVQQTWCMQRRQRRRGADLAGRARAASEGSPEGVMDASGMLKSNDDGIPPGVATEQILDEASSEFD